MCAKCLVQRQDPEDESGVGDSSKSSGCRKRLILIRMKRKAKCCGWTAREVNIRL